MSSSESVTYTNPPTPKARFTGIFIPVEILEMSELNHTEIILLSWIDALYDKQRGGCYASNEYIGEKLGLKEKHISDLISKLIRLGLIEKVSFDGRIRIIRACKENWFRQEPDSCQNRNLNPETAGTCVLPKQEPHSIYSKEESKGNICVGNARVREKKPEIKMIEFGKFVKMTEEDHKKFVQTHGKDVTNEIIESINDYCSNHKTGGYKDYAAAFRTFAKRDSRKIIDSGEAKPNNRGRSNHSQAGDKPSLKQGIFVDGELRK